MIDSGSGGLVRLMLNARCPGIPVISRAFPDYLRIPTRPVPASPGAHPVRDCDRPIGPIIAHLGDAPGSPTSLWGVWSEVGDCLHRLHQYAHSHNVYPPCPSYALPDESLGCLSSLFPLISLVVNLCSVTCTVYRLMSFYIEHRPRR